MSDASSNIRKWETMDREERFYFLVKEDSLDGAREDRPCD